MTVDIHYQDKKTISAGATVTFITLEQKGGLKYIRGNVRLPGAGTLIIEHNNYRGDLVDKTEKSITTAGGITYDVLVISFFTRIRVKNDTATAYVVDCEVYTEYDD